MSLKDEINYVKEELSGDEKLLESAFRLERLYKKHKRKIWVAGALLVLGFGGQALYGVYRDYRLAQANEALLILQKQPEDRAALERLKSDNPRLYALYTYAKAVEKGQAKALEALETSGDPLLKDLSRYHVSVLSEQAGDSRYYTDLSRVEKAYLALKAGKKAEAKTQLALVSENSPVAPIARLLRHYTITQ